MSQLALNNESIGYTYDGVGNRMAQALNPGTGLLTDTYTYPTTNNQLQSIALGAGGTRSFTYDAAGNVTYDNRSGQGYGYTYDNAGRMASFSLNGVVQAEYVYNQLGQQIIRRLTQQGITIHSVYGPDGKRIAEYNEATGALIRQYIWLEGAPIAVIEGGVVSFVAQTTSGDRCSRPTLPGSRSGPPPICRSAECASRPGHRRPRGSRGSGFSPKPACTRTGCGITIRPQGGTCRPTRWA